jgi:hypothetical protein
LLNSRDQGYEDHAMSEDDEDDDEGDGSYGDEDFGSSPAKPKKLAKKKTKRPPSTVPAVRRASLPIRILYCNTY